MKKMIRIALMATALGCMALTASAEDEGSSYAMLPDTEYEIDLQGDGTMEKVLYKTYTSGEEEESMNCQAVLELYVNDQLVQTLTDENWSYNWLLDQFQTSDHATLLLANSYSDNDWTTQSLLLSFDGTDFETIADLTILSRSDAENEIDNKISEWGRCRGIVNADDNTVTVSWLDVTKATGSCLVNVTYVWEDGVLTMSEDAPVLDPEQTWTARLPFTVYDKIGEDAEAVFEVSEGDVVQLTELIHEGDKIYFKCINADGESGWLPDADDYITDTTGDTYQCGYFEEAIYAG